VYIKATPEAIWDAITEPEWTERYGYGGRGEYDLRPGRTTRDSRPMPCAPWAPPTWQSRVRSSRRTRRGASS